MAEGWIPAGVEPSFRLERQVRPIMHDLPSQVKSGYSALWASQVVLVAKNLPANAEDVRDMGSIPGLGRSPGGGHSNPLQYSCLENPLDRGAWRATINRVAKSRP